MGEFDPSACSLTEDEVQALIRERMRSRRVQNFEEADGIKRRLEECGIELDDKSKQWRVGVPNESGHTFRRIGGPVDPTVCALDEGRINALLQERARLRRAGSFEEADGIRSELRRAGVRLDDKRGEWRADGVLADGTRMRPSIPIRTGADADDGLNMHGHVYKEIGERMDASIVALPRDEVHHLLRERMQARRAGEFKRADEILHRLRDEGVFVDDKSNTWKADVLNEHGHEYAYIGEPFESMNLNITEEEVHGLLKERARCKRRREFDRAEKIEWKLRGAGVEMNEKRKLWNAFRRESRHGPGEGPKDASTRRAPTWRDDDGATALSSSSLRVKDCKTIEEAIALSADDVGPTATRRVAAFWAVAPRLLDEYLQRPAREPLASPKQLGKMLSLIVENVRSFSPRELSATALGLARIVKKVRTGKHRGEEFPEGSPHAKLHRILSNPEMRDDVFKQIASAAVGSIEDFDARCLANLTYACAVADHAPEVDDGTSFFDCVAERSIALLGIFKPQELSNLLWAYARLGMSHPDLFREAGDAVALLEGLGRFTGQALSNLVWSYATAKERHPELFAKVADHILSLKSWGNFQPQTFSNVLWAYASAEFSHPALIKRMGDHIASLDDLSEFRAQHLSNIPWAYARVREAHPALFGRIVDAAVERQGEFNSQGVANFLWACATNGHVGERPFSSLAPSVGRLLGSCNGQEVANVAWAYSAANAEAPSVFNNAFVDVCLAKEDEFHIESLSQLHQWQLWREELGSDVELPPSLKDKCHEAFILRGPERSSIQDDVVSELFSIGLRPEVERLTRRGYLIDALVEVNGKRVAVEFDGPFHFVGRKPAGRTILKRRQVAKLEGIRVASVPYWEWGELGEDRGKKQMYLQLLLDLF